MDAGSEALLRDFQTIMAVSRAMGSERDLDRLLGLILRAVTDLVHADRASLFLVDRDRGQLWTRIAQGAEEIRLPLGSGIAGAVAGSGQAINIASAYDDPRFNPENDRRTGYRTRSILCMPMVAHDGAVVGVVQALNKHGGEPFGAYDEQILAALGAQAGVAVDTAQLILRDAERRRLERDMELARQIQLSLLPEQPPEVPGWRFATYSRSCDQTGGDYFDFLAAPGGIDIAIGDVSGHGIGAAMMMSTARAFLRALHDREQRLGKLMGSLNALLERDMADDAFMTMLLVRLGEDGVRFSSAGHEPPMILRAGGFEELGGSDLMLGVLDDSTYAEHALPPMSRGDLLVLSTDGIGEAQRPPRYEMWGKQRLQAAVAGAAARGAVAVRDAVVAAVGAHLDGAAPHDDMTLVIAEKL
jgi:sigma-B regulation protein RsbU (phosphoserine phosphatase)